VPCQLGVFRSTAVGVNEGSILRPPTSGLGINKRKKMLGPLSRSHYSY
jgi:hypothetical protein